MLAALAALGILGAGRGLILSLRGVRILAIDRERTGPQALADLGFVVCFLLWVYESVAFALPLDFHVVPDAARKLVLDAVAARAAGALALAAGLAVYALALRALGASWRLGIDRNHPGGLVTGGIFARCRNPVYLGLSLLIAGSFLVLGRLVLLALAIACTVYFRQLVRREERFLAERYGDAYREYAARVGRWWSFRRAARVPQ